jgi:hypothetical protein
MIIHLAIAAALSLWLPSFDLLGLGGRGKPPPEDGVPRRRKEGARREAGRDAQEGRGEKPPDAKKILELLAQQAQAPQNPERSEPTRADKARATRAGKPWSR